MATEEMHLTGERRMTLEERIRRNILQKLGDWVESMPEPDTPIIGVAADGEEEEMVSPRQIFLHVQRRTRLGEEFVERWVDMISNHIAESRLR